MSTGKVFLKESKKGLLFCGKRSILVGSRGLIPRLHGRNLPRKGRYLRYGFCFQGAQTVDGPLHGPFFSEDPALFDPDHPDRASAAAVQRGGPGGRRAVRASERDQRRRRDRRPDQSARQPVHGAVRRRRRVRRAGRRRTGQADGPPHGPHGDPVRRYRGRGADRRRDPARAGDPRADGHGRGDPPGRVALSADLLRRKHSDPALQLRRVHTPRGGGHAKPADLPFHRGCAEHLLKPVLRRRAGHERRRRRPRDGAFAGGVLLPRPAFALQEDRRLQAVPAEITHLSVCAGAYRPHRRDCRGRCSPSRTS